METFDVLDTALLLRLAAEQGTFLTEEQVARLARYAALLVEGNERMNLTAITDPVGMARKHFADSLTLLPLLPEGPFSLIDVGTGAGFPGIPLAILRPDCRLTLLDSLNKRLGFLKAVCGELNISARRVHARAEEGGRQAALREKFDVATARAVASLPALCEYCLPFVKPGGVFLAMKGPEGETEMAAAGKAVFLLGGRLRELRPVEIGGGEEPLHRRLIIIEKIAPTPALYPRISAKIKKQPL